MENRISGYLASSSGLTLTIVFRSLGDDGIIAECMEIPGCMAQGDNEGEARQAIADTIEECLSVLLEDAIRAAGSGRAEDFNMVGIARQEQITVLPPHLQLEAVIA